MVLTLVNAVNLTSNYDFSDFDLKISFYFIRLLVYFLIPLENMKFTFSISRFCYNSAVFKYFNFNTFHVNSMAPIFLHVKIQIFKQYYFKYLVGNLHLKLYQLVYENLNNNSLQYYFYMQTLQF